MSEETKVEATEQQQQADASKLIVDSILNVGKPQEVGKAPESVKPEAKASETEKAQSPAKETASEGKTDNKSEADKSKVEEIAKIDLAEIANEVFGIPKPQEETVESLKQKYANSSKEALKKHAELKELQEFLKTNNLEIVRDGEGKPVLTVPKDFEDKYDVEKEIQGLNLKLSEEQIDKLVENPDNQGEILKGLVKKALLAQLAKRPAVKSRPTEQPLLSDDDKHNVFAEFVNAKNRVGLPMFPDAASDKIIPIYQMLYNADTPDMRALRDVAERNADVHGAMLKLLYFQAKDIMRIAEAKEAEARKRIEESKKKLNESVIPTVGDASTPASTMQKTGGSYEDSVKSSILSI